MMVDKPDPEAGCLKLRRRVMLKKVAYLAALVSGSLMAGACGWYGLALDNVPRVITAILNEELFG